MSIREDMLAMMLDGGGSPAPPQPTIVGTDKVYKAWRIGDTDLFLGVGSCVYSPYSSGAKFEYKPSDENYKVFYPGLFVFKTMWGLIADGKANTVIGLRDNFGNNFYPSGESGTDPTIYDYAEFDSIPKPKVTKYSSEFQFGFGYTYLRVYGHNKSDEEIPDYWDDPEKYTKIFGNMYCDSTLFGITNNFFVGKSIYRSITEYSYRHNVFPSKDMMKRVLSDNIDTDFSEVEFKEIEINPAIKEYSMFNGIMEEPSWEEEE